MSALTVRVTLAGASEAELATAALANALENRGPMHARMAVRGKQFTQDYLLSINRHQSAGRLGAVPSGHNEKSAASVEAQSDDTAATITIPRRTGLGRAFGDVTIRPGNGRKYLTIPGHARTYGKSVRDFPGRAFRFAILLAHRPFPVLMFAGGADDGKVAYWLRTEVTQKQDRTLLPSDEGYAEVAIRAAREYLTEEVAGRATA